VPELRKAPSPLTQPGHDSRCHGPCPGEWAKTRLTRARRPFLGDATRAPRKEVP
jgi:hypothetical protein